MLGWFQEFVFANIPQARMVEASDVHLKYMIAPGSLKLSQIFEKVEAARQMIAIDDYGVSQTSLEQVRAHVHTLAALGRIFT